MIDKFCIIIDDEPQDGIIKNLCRGLKRENINLECEQLNPQDDKYNKNKGTESAPEYVIDLDEIIKDLNTSKYLKRKVDLIACDYSLQDDEVNGFEIIRKLRNELNYNKEIVLYSANLDNVIREILEDRNKQKHIQKIRNLVNAKISDICKRESYKTTIIGVLKQNKFSLESELESRLYKHSDLKFKSTFPVFKDKLLAEIIDEIRSNSPQAVEFQKELIERIVSNLVALNTGE